MATKQPHICVNARYLIKDRMEGIGRYSLGILKEMVLAHPEVHFTFIFDRPYSDTFIFAPNVEAIVLRPPARHPFLFILFFEFSVYRLLKRLKPDVFFSPGGFLSLRTKVPQVQTVHDLAFMHFPDDVRPIVRWYYHLFFPKFVQKASHILSVSESSKADLMETFKIASDKISVVHNALDSSILIAENPDFIAIRKKFSGGTRYFHFVGSMHPRKNVIRLIKAFELFKSKYGSDHKLLLVGRHAWHLKELNATYEQSPYIEDIIFTGYLSDTELNQLSQGSDALCYVPYFEGFGIPILEGMRHGIPVITSNTSSMPEVAGEAAILVNPFEPESIADGMARVVNEPDLRKDLIEKGYRRLQEFSWEKSAKKAWDILDTYLPSSDNVK